jgi:DNA polymerase-3 subunit delta'
LPTIKSRCQIVRFGPVDEDRIVSRLTEMGVGREPATFFARLAQGSLGLACQWARLEPAGVGLFDIKRKAIASLAALEMADALDLAEQLGGDARKIAAGWADLDEATSKSDLNRRAQKTLIQILVSALRDAMMLSADRGRPLINADQSREIAALAGRFDFERAAQGITEGYEMLRWIEANVNERLIFDRLLLRLAPSAIMARTW